MEPVPAPNGTPCHSERVRPAVARGIRNLSALLLLFPLALFAPSCEKLPDAPNIPPTAAFIYNPVAPINAGQTTVTFTAVGSHDTDGTIASFDWTWGDGTPEQTTTSPTATHVFADTPLRCINATYSVLLTVTDNKGDTGTASQQVTVTELPEPGSLECAK